MCVEEGEKERECVRECVCVESEGQEINDAKEKGDGAWPRPFFGRQKGENNNCPNFNFQLKTHTTLQYPKN